MENQNEEVKERTCVVYENKKGGGRFMTTFTEGKVYEDDEVHIIVATDVSEAEARRLCDERQENTITSYLGDLPPELRDPRTDAYLANLIREDDPVDGKKFPDASEYGIPIGEVLETDTIWFHVKNDSKEVLKFCANGDIYIWGRLAENDKEVVQGMRDFLEANMQTKGNIDKDYRDHHLKSSDSVKIENPESKDLRIE